MSDDFCLYHGTEHMLSRMGDPIPYCEACERNQEYYAWLSNLTSAELSAIGYKIVDFIREVDPFGDRISRYEIRVLSKAFADLGVARATPSQRSPQESDNER